MNECKAQGGRRNRGKREINDEEKGETRKGEDDCGACGIWCRDMARV